MSYQQAYEFDYMAEERDMGHFIDEIDEEDHGSDEVYDEYEMVCYSYFLIRLVCVFLFSSVGLF